MNKNSLNERYRWFFIFAFFAILLVPLKNLNFNPSEINEGFYGRSRLISWVAKYRVGVGDRVFEKAIIAKDGWLFYTGEKNINNYQNSIPYSDEELARIQIYLDLATAKYAEEGITLLLVVPPAKHSIYPEFMPDEIPVLGAMSRLDQLVAYLSAHGSARLLDLRPALLEAKHDQQVYYATDTHWNMYGAYIGYREIIDQLGQKNPGLIPHSLDDFTISVTKPAHLDIARLIGASALREEEIDLTPKYKTTVAFREVKLGDRKIMFSSSGNDELPKAVVYYDSFFFSVIPLLGEHFDQAFYVQNYIGGGIWNLVWVDEMKPDIVIVEFSERYIQDIAQLLKP